MADEPRDETLRNHRLDAAIDRYWDAIADGRLAMPAGDPDPDLDPRLARTIRRVHALAGDPLPDPNRADQLWRDLMSGYAPSIPLPLAPSYPAPSNGRDHTPRPVPRPLARPARQGHRRLHAALSAIATAALIAAIIGLIVTLYDQNNQATPPPGPVASPSVPAGTPGGEWSSMRGGAGRTSYVDDTGPTTEFGTLWTFRVPGSLHFPVVAGDAVYVNSNDGLLYALDARTGQQRWVFDPHSPSGTTNVFPSVTADGGMVYLPTVAGDLYALDAATGTLVWTATMAGSQTGNAAIVDGTLYATTDNGNVAALDAATGAAKWSVELGALASRSTPAVAAGTVFQGDDKGRLTALDAATGAVRWTAQLGGIVLTPAVSGDTVIVATTIGVLAALDAATGAERWRVTDSADGVDTVASPAIADGTVVFNRRGKATVALDAATGAQIWSVDLISPGTAPTIGGTVVYVIDALDQLVALDLATGLILGSVKVTGGGSGSSALAGGVLYVAGTRTLTALGANPTTPIANRATPPATNQASGG